MVMLQTRYKFENVTALGVSRLSLRKRHSTKKGDCNHTTPLYRYIPFSKSIILVAPMTCATVEGLT